MPRDSSTSGLEISLEALAYSNAVTLQAVVELLAEKGVIDWDEVYNRVKKLKREPESKGSA
jgi:hypothetical protein